MHLNALHNLQWYSLAVELRNTRSVSANAHPLGTIQGVCNFAYGKKGVIFRPDEPFGDCIIVGHIYRFTVIFPQSTPAHVAAFAGGLYSWLANPRNNFAIHQVSGPTLQTGATTISNVLKELPPETDQVCLDFITPLHFNPNVTGGQEVITPTELFLGFQRRLMALFNCDISARSNGWCGVETICRHWRYRLLYKHDSKSQKTSDGKKQRYIMGCVGPLYLRGNLKPVLPLLALGTELNAGGQKYAGVGCYRLSASHEEL